MSLKGVFTALSGALAQTQKIDTIANNIANVNTTGFKKDQQTFNEYLTAVEKEQDVIQVPRIPASIESFYDMNGADKAYVNSAGTYTNFEQGSLKNTGSSMDVAIEGNGFFEISTPDGVRLTRAGNFSIDANGQLVNKDGHPVLMQVPEGEEAANIPLEKRIVKFSGTQVPALNDLGEISDGTQKLGQLSVVNVKNPESLHKIGNNNFIFKSNMTPELETIRTPSLKQGFLESSNVNIIQEMTDMIMAQRIYEGTQKAISTYDSMADKLINQVGNTKG